MRGVRPGRAVPPGASTGRRRGTGRSRQPGPAGARAKVRHRPRPAAQRQEPPRVDELANRLWYPLWDARIRLDHSVRTPAECAEVAGRELSAGVGLLDLRRIAGDAGLVTGARSALLDAWRGSARRRLPELLDAQSDRWQLFGDAAYLLEPDLKEARGGLRDMIALAGAGGHLADRPSPHRGSRAVRAAARRSRRPAPQRGAGLGPAATQRGRRRGPAAGLRRARRSSSGREPGCATDRACR